VATRDSAHLNTRWPGFWDYHNYRDLDIQNYVLAAEKLADDGYFVIRMGADVQQVMNSSHSRVIDYAANGMRSEFMDIYLGAKCDFCISGSSGFNAVPLIFRRPIAITNDAPFGYQWTSSEKFIGITRHHYSAQEERELTLKEIFSGGSGFYLHGDEYESQSIQLIENTPEEIRDIAVEMASRLRGTWEAQKGDEELQRKFWEIYPADTRKNGKPLHGEIRSRIGAAFLRDNQAWLK
jgi:putative glycosyltransferase (TIGR04372 family)